MKADTYFENANGEDWGNLPPLWQIDAYANDIRGLLAVALNSLERIEAANTSEKIDLVTGIGAIMRYGLRKLDKVHDLVTTLDDLDYQEQAGALGNDQAKA